MTVEINKTFFIKIIIVLALCIGCFCLGIFLRFSSTSENPQKLINGITISQETAEELAKSLNIGGEALKSTSSYEKAVLDGINVLKESNKTGLKCIELLDEAFIENEKLTEKYLSVNTNIIVNELQKAEEQALIYEKLFDEYKNIKEQN